MYQIKPDTGKSTVNFGNLVDAASEIAVAKDNAAESVGDLSMNQISGGDKSKSRCGYCSTDFHNSSGFLTEARKKLCKAWGKKCDTCGLENHISTACRADKVKKCSEERGKKASVKEATAVTLEAQAGPAVQNVQPPPSSALNSTPPAGYTFDRDRFTDITCSFWKVSSSAENVSLQNSSCASPAMGHYVFDRVTQSWKSQATSCSES